MCSYRYSCLDLPVVLVYCHMEGCPLCLHHVCQGCYVVFDDIEIHRAERRICCDCVDELQGWIKSDMLKKVVDKNVNGTYES